MLRRQPEAQPDDDFSPFADRDYGEPRRRSPVLAILIVLILIAAAAAAFWFFAPAEWKHRLGLADAGTTPLTLVTTHMDRQKLASGNELLTVAGRVVNPTAASHSVPPIYARLKTKSGQVIYSLDDRAAGADPCAGRERIVQQRRGQRPVRAGTS